MKTIPAACKFCGQKLNLQIDDSYDVVGDPFKLLPLAACNRCADYHAQRLKLEEILKKACSALPSNPAQVRATLEKTLLRYASLVADHWRTNNLPTGEVVDQLMVHPEQYFAIIKQANRTIRNAKRAPTQLEINHPYPDH